MHCMTTITCLIRYEIDPFQREAFREYAQNWLRIIPRCGGDLLGYFLPHEGTNNIAWGLIAFESLAAYEAYRAPESRSGRARELRVRAEGPVDFAGRANVPGDAALALLHPRAGRLDDLRDPSRV